MLDTEEVTGSNPVSPTITKRPLASGNAGRGFRRCRVCSDTNLGPARGSFSTLCPDLASIVKRDRGISGSKVAAMRGRARRLPADARWGVQQVMESDAGE